MKRHTKITFWCTALVVLMLGYGFHFFVSLIPTSADHERSLDYIAQMQEEINLEQTFAAEGAEFVAVSPIMNGSKEYGAVFHLKKGSPCIIPATIQNYVETYPERSHGRAITLITYAGKRWDEGTPHISKTYFWWRFLY